MSFVLSLLSELKIQNVICKPSKLLSSCGKLIGRSWSAEVSRCSSHCSRNEAVSGQSRHIQPLQHKLLYELDPLPSSFPLPISLKICLLGQVRTSWIFIALDRCRWETFISHPCLSAVTKRISSQGISVSLLESTKLLSLFVFANWESKQIKWNVVAEYSDL